MLAVQIKLYRPYDRHPTNHEYGEPFDSSVDELIGGRSRWSPPRNESAGSEEYPRANVLAADGLTIELHEDGPLIEFILQHVDQIPVYINAIAAAVQAWAAARALRRETLPKDDLNAPSQTVIEMGDLRIESKHDLSPMQLSELVKSLAPLHLGKQDRSDKAAGRKTRAKGRK